MFYRLYVVRRTDQGGGWLAADVNKTGHSYTRRLEDAKMFTTYSAADNARCEANEVVEGIGPTY